MSGWIKLHRQILNWEWYGDVNVVGLFVHCLLMANFEDSKWRGIDIRKGSFISSRAKLSSATGLSIQQVRTALDKLKSTNDVTSEGTSEYTVFTVINYDFYQSSTSETTNDQPAKQQTNNPPNNPPNNHSIRSKEDKKKRNIFPFRKYLLDLSIDEKLVDEWLAVRKNKKLVNTETAFQDIKKHIDLANSRGVSANDCIRMAVTKSWGGFKYSWYEREVSGDTAFGTVVQPTIDFKPAGKHNK